MPSLSQTVEELERMIAFRKKKEGQECFDIERRALDKAVRTIKRHIHLIEWLQDEEPQIYDDWVEETHPGGTP